MIRSLAYLGVTSPNADQWRSFGPDVLGAEVVADGTAANDGDVLLRFDNHPWRLAVGRGNTDDVAFIGWDVGDPGALGAVAARVAETGTTVHDGEAELEDARQVDELRWFVDPFGFRHELTLGRRSADEPFEASRPMEGGFVTGNGGMGHVVLIVDDLDRATDFFVGVLGFAHSDDVDAGVRIRFLHCNPRHHSLAFTAVPGMVGMHHLMLEVEHDDDVGRAYDIVVDRGDPVAMTLGRHTNDRMLSFYVRTPSGFEIEYGSGGRLLDPAQPHEPEHYVATSVWGHHPPDEPLLPAILRSVVA